MGNSDRLVVISPPDDFIPFDRAAINGSLVDRFEKIVARFPDNLAVVWGTKKITYQALNETANRIAHSILSISPPDCAPVPFILEHGSPAITAIIGILKAGKAYVPVDPNLPPARINQILNDLDAPLVLTNNKNHPTTIASIKKEENSQDPLTPHFEGPTFDVLNLDRIDRNTPGTNPDINIFPADNAYILYTSGSTGTPKGVVHTHLDSMHNNIAQGNELKFSPSDRFGLIISLGFEASRFSLHGALLNGASLYLYDIRNEGLGDLSEWLIRESITVLVTTPSTFLHTLSMVPENIQYPKMRLLNLGGEPISSHIVAQYRRRFSKTCVLINTLGMTETGIIARFFVDHQTELSGYSIPSGYPIEGKTIELVNENGQIVKPGQVGEILVKSRYLSPGYWNRPDLTSEKFFQDPLEPDLRVFHTGDLGKIHPDGYLENLGRKDNQVKIRGFRIEISDIEAAILLHPLVRNCAVVALDRQHAPEEKQLAAYIETIEKKSLSRKDLRAFIDQKLPNYMAPSTIIFLENLPLTPTGKINHSALPDPEESDQNQEQEYVAPRDEVETQLVKIWERTLKIHSIGVQSNYFELGGTSLSAAQLFAQIEKMFRKKLPLTTLFQAPTIEGQAGILRQDNWVPDWSSLVALQPNGSKPPLFFAAPVGGNVLSYRDILAYLPPDQPVYGLQAIGLDGVQRPNKNINDIVAHYIQEIQAVQPKGPYYLLGSSFGGIVAYEMAQKLHEMGASIDLVVLFDAYGPNYPNRLPSTSRVRRKAYKYLRRIDTHMSNLANTNWQGKVGYMRVKGKKLWRRVRRGLQRRVDNIIHPLPSELKKVEAAQFKAAKKRKRHMRSKRQFGGRLVLFRATKQPMGIYPEPTLGWHNVVGDNIEVYEISGHHTSIIYEPRAAGLSVILNQILDEEHGVESK